MYVIATMQGQVAGIGFLEKGSIWPADDPAVVAHPGMFEDIESVVQRSVPLREEKATTAVPKGTQTRTTQK